MIIGKPKVDEILGEQIMKIKYQGLRFAKHVPISSLVPSISKAAPKTPFVKATYAAKVKTSLTNAVAKSKINVPPKKVITSPKVKV